MVTIKMIAKECGRSPATVSKALNGASDVSAETVELVRKTAERMGYMPNSAARALKTSRSYSFGVLFEDATHSGLTHEFFSAILNSFKHRAEELGYDIYFISNRLGGRTISYTEHAHYRNCDGILIAAVDYTKQGVLDLVQSGIPIVTIDYEFNACSSVSSDNVQGMRDLVQYVHSLGHTKLALIHGEDTTATRQRVSSFFRVCGELGIQIPSEYVIPAFFHDPASSAKATRQLMALKNRPSCIFYPDDVSYIGGMNEFEQMGLTVPDDVCAVGYDGVKISTLFRPPLTTMKQDSELIGTSAADELVKAVLEGKSYLTTRITIPGKLLPGETVRRWDSH